MAIFWRIFIKTIALFFSISFILILVFLLFIFAEDKKDNFFFVSGAENSKNIIPIIELSGLIINDDIKLSNFTLPFIISPTEVQNNLNDLISLSPDTIIISINSPGGTVSASKKLYDIIHKYKKNNKSEIIVHTNELLASGGYWVATSADKIYAHYGSIIGSIGVKGPDWFYYDEPVSISTGIFGNQIETKNGIKLFSNKAGKSKDIFNPFRKPNNEELDHLQNMVNEIYEDFVRTVSRERKIETHSIVNEIGALIYTSNEAVELQLIDDEMGIEDLINKIVNLKNYKDYKVIKKYNNKNNILKEIFSSFLQPHDNMKLECITLRSSFATILSYQSIGC